MNRLAHLWLLLLTALVALTACHGDRPHVRPEDPGERGTIHALSDADTLLATDLLGSLLEETSGTGVTQARFAAYPFGVARFDTSEETRKYASVPRDGAVSLDHMGARFYAPDLGIWTSGEPLAITAPERLVTDQFAAANPYAYANLSPEIAADRDGHFWHVAIGGAIGALLGGGIEAARQYSQFGKIEDVGRIEAAAVGGFVSGSLTALNPAASLASVMGSHAATSVASGMAERLVTSGGKSAGTLTEAATDAVFGGLSAGVVHGATPLVRDVAQKTAKAIGGAVSRVLRGSTTILGENMPGRVIPFAEKTGARTLPFAKVSEDEWKALSPREQWKLNDGTLRERIGDGDRFRYIGQDPRRTADVRREFDLTRSELLRLDERGIPYETVPHTEVQTTVGRP